MRIDLRQILLNRDPEVARERAVALYWRNAYEMLVRQTGRDLNDGLGLDPRKLRTAARTRRGNVETE